MQNTQPESCSRRGAARRTSCGAITIEWVASGADEPIFGFCLPCLFWSVSFAE